jgi:hypothetical protein
VRCHISGKRLALKGQFRSQINNANNSHLDYHRFFSSAAIAL